MTAARPVVRGATMALTRRTTMRKAFLGPWNPDVEKVILYAVADAQHHTGVAVHSVVPMINHLHLCVTPSQPNLPEFKRRVFRDISCGLQAVLRREKYDAPRELFDDRQPHAMRLLDAAAQASHLVYERLNPVAAGLVERPEAHPYRCVHWADWKSGRVPTERPEGYFGRSRAALRALEVTPSPWLYWEYGGDLGALRFELDKMTEHGRRALRACDGRPPMGASALRCLHPWSEPRTPQEPGGERVPTFRIGARGMVGKRARCDAAREVTAFRKRHREVRIARRDGTSTDAFPFGTYARRVFHGDPVEAEAAPDAIVTAPGPQLEEVRSELARTSVAEPGRNLRAEVADAFDAEAAEIREQTELDLVLRQDRSGPGGERSGEEESSAQGPRVTHVQDRPRLRRQDEGTPGREITLRDRRRRRRGGDEGGGDPPE